MEGAPLYSVAVGAGLQVVLMLVSVCAPRRVGAGTFYRLSAVIQFFVMGALAGAGTWWALMPGGIAVAFAVAAWTVPARERRNAHLASLIHADRTDP